MGRSGTITLDTSTSDGEAGDVLNFDVTVNSENSMLILGLGNPNFEMNATNSTIRYNGVDMTHLVSMNQDGNSFTSIWFMKNPPTGTHSLSCGFVSPAEKVGIALVYTGAALVTPPSGTGGATSASTLTLSVTADAQDSVLVGFWTSTQDKTASSGTTEIIEHTFGGTPVKLAGSESTDPVSAGVQSLEMTHSTSQWSGAICALSPEFITSGQPAYTGGAGFMF